MRLKPDVRRQMLQLRSKYMEHLDELFHERQSLNLQAIKVLLPPDLGKAPTHQLTTPLHGCIRA